MKHQPRPVPLPKRVRSAMNRLAHAAGRQHVVEVTTNLTDMLLRMRAAGADEQRLLDAITQPPEKASA